MYSNWIPNGKMGIEKEILTNWKGELVSLRESQFPGRARKRKKYSENYLKI